MAEVILEEVGPNGNAQALVELDNDTYYLYLYGAPETGFGTNSVWVRNIGTAPKEFERERMQEGCPPRNPASYCRFPEGQPLFQKEKLRIVWLPEGNGIALYEEAALLAIIPPWSGYKGFHGYARDCQGIGPVAWEMTQDNILHNRFSEAQAFWDQWEEEGLWRSIQQSLSEEITSALGKESNYYAIDGGYWPPKSILRIPRNNHVVLITIGVSIRPQPNVERYIDKPQDFRRIELGVVLPGKWTDGTIKEFASYLSAQANLPWAQYTWLGSGHTIGCKWRNDEFTNALLVTEHPAIPSLLLNQQFGDPVNILWLLPISDQERKLAEEKGSKELLRMLPQNRWIDA